MTRAVRRRSRPVVIGASAALVLAAVVGAVLVFQPDAATASGAVRRLAHVLAGGGLPYTPTATVVEFSLNVALFVPGAFAAALLWPRVRWWRWALVGLAVSGCIETVQGVFLTNRDAQVRDLVSNTLGAALGAGMALAARRLQAHRRRARRRRPVETQPTEHSADTSSSPSGHVASLASTDAQAGGPGGTTRRSDSTH